MSSKVPLENGSEYLCEGWVVNERKSYNVEVSLEAWRNKRLASAWWTHGCDENGVENVAEWVLVVLAVVPTAIVDELT